MRDLAELTDKLPWNKLRSSPVWSGVLEPGSKMSRLFDLLRQYPDLTDAHAAELLYGSPGATARLQSLKNKLKKRLLASVPLLDHNEPAFTDREKAHFECNKQWAIAMTLLAQNARRAGIELLEQTLRLTRRFEFTELNLNVLHYLRQYHGSISGDTRKYEQYRDQYKACQTVWQMENEAEERYTALISRMMNTRSPQTDLGELAAEEFRHIQPYLSQSDSFRLHLSGRLLHLVALGSRNDYRAIADHCEQALSFFEKKPFESTLPAQVFYYQLVVCCVQLRDFGRGQAIIRRHQHLYPVGSYNWFKVQELYFLLALHTQHYDDAFDTCEMVSQHPELPRQPAPLREMWKIYEAYAQLLVRTRRADRQPARAFRPAKFVNETPLFSKDKRGMNIPILIAQFLFDVADKRYDRCIERVEALRKYSGRYLKKGENLRSQCFLKMLLEIPEAAFHREAAARKAERYRLQLRQAPVELANQAHEIEIIPYEDLWDMIFEFLPAKISDRPKAVSG